MPKQWAKGDEAWARYPYRNAQLARWVVAEASPTRLELAENGDDGGPRMVCSPEWLESNDESESVREGRRAERYGRVDGVLSYLVSQYKWSTVLEALLADCEREPWFGSGYQEWFMHGIASLECAEEQSR